MPAPRRPRPRRGYMRAESEEAFQAAVIQLARYNGWTVWHPPKNRPSAKTGRVVPTLGVVAGWPDLAFARAHAGGVDLGCVDLVVADVVTAAPRGEFMLAELKAEKGRLSPAQTDAIALLRACGVEVHVWRPSDWPTIDERLRRDPSG